MPEPKLDFSDIARNSKYGVNQYIRRIPPLVLGGRLARTTRIISGYIDESYSIELLTGTHQSNLSWTLLRIVCGARAVGAMIMILNLVRRRAGGAPPGSARATIYILSGYSHGYEAVPRPALPYPYFGYINSPRLALSQISMQRSVV